MSSKRKNTPTKLSKDDVLIHREHSIENGSDGDSHNESDSESESSLSLHIVSKSDQIEDYENGADSPGSLDRPQSKKQRILQSVKCDNESDTDPEVSYLNNNNILTKPTVGLMNTRKSMDSVLRRLNHKADSHHHTMKGNHTVQEGGDVIDSIKAAMSSSESVEDKEKKLSLMIAQLQNMKESLAQQKDSIEVSR